MGGGGARVDVKDAVDAAAAFVALVVACSWALPSGMDKRGLLPEDGFISTKSRSSRSEAFLEALEVPR